jgi:hypothetical protein
MIIKGERITSSRSATPLLRHLLNGEKNECVTLVQGTNEDVRAAFADARYANKKFALRHFIISPVGETSDAEAIMILGLLGKEFGFDPATPIIFKHDTPRAVATAFGAHWHALTPELVDAATGRVMDSRYNFLRHEKVAIIAAYRLGRTNEFVRSNHEKAVLAALESDGHLDVAAALRAFIASDPGEAHREAFSRDTHQKGKRLGVDVPAARAAVRAAWETTTGWTEFTTALDADGYRVSTGDRDGTLIVETHDGVFIGAAHRLARVRKIDLKKRREFTDERTAEAKPRPRDAREDARRYPADTVGTVDSGRRDAEGSAAGGPQHPVVVVHPDHNAGFPVQSGSDASAAGRRGAFDSGRFAVGLRIALNRNPAAANRLLDWARQLARTPSERVTAKLVGLEKKLKDELNELLTPHLTLPQLDDARQRLTVVQTRDKKLDAVLKQLKEQRERYLQRRPKGLMAGVRGDTAKWTKGLAALDMKLASVVAKSKAVWDQRKGLEGLAADLDKELRRRKRVLFDAADNQKKLFVCRREMARVSIARKILDKNPAIAFGGLTMLLLAAAAAAIINGMFARQFGTEPFRNFR